MSRTCAEQLRGHWYEWDFCARKSTEKQTSGAGGRVARLCHRAGTGASLREVIKAGGEA